MRMLDLFAGRLGWSKAFLARGWEVLAIDLVMPLEVPRGCQFIQCDVLKMRAQSYGCIGIPLLGEWKFDFVCVSSPCEQFSIHSMKHFHPNPPYPEIGIKLFNHARALCEDAGLPYIMENVRAAQQFIGNAVHHCGPFYLWGNAVPPILPQGIKKGISWGSSKDINQFREQEQKRAYRRNPHFYNHSYSTSDKRKNDVATVATIPSELAACVVDYADRILAPDHPITRSPDHPMVSHG